MRNGDYHQNLHHQTLSIHKTTFLPMLCSRPSIKDVAVPKSEDHHHHHRRSASSFSEDPLSPKIGCMGQVKIRNNKIIGFPTFTTTTSTFTSLNSKLALTSKSNNNNVKYFKLKKLFSGKNFTNNRNSPSASLATSTIASSCRRREPSISGVNKRQPPPPPKVNDEISIVDMDPPLPVIKRVAKPDDGNGDSNSIWKRRSGGGALKSLELQRIQVPRLHQTIEINTV